MKKLGQLLLEKSWITGEQLTRALQNQRVVGGRLGTCLLEMEVLPEDLLLRALGEQLRVPAASPEDLRGIADDIIGMLPQRIAARCRAVPFRVLGGQVDVAMLDVKNLGFQDELGFVIGRRVKIHIANEARIFEALEKYYGEEAPSRLVHLLDRLNRARYLWDKETKSGRGAPVHATDENLWSGPNDAFRFPLPATFPSPPSFPVFTPPPPANAPRTESDMEPVTQVVPPPPTAVPSPGASAASPPAAATAPAPPPAALAAPPAPPVAATPPPAPSQAPARPQAVPRPQAVSVPLAPEERAQLAAQSTRAPAAPLSLTDAETRLMAPTDRDQVATTILDYLAQTGGRVALFRVQRKEVQGWMGRGLDVEQLRQFTADSAKPSVFLNILQGSAYYRGPLAPLPVHRELARTWGGKLPAECVLLPIRIREKVVAVIYLDRDGESSGAMDIEQLLRLAAKAAIAFELCIMRNKLRKA